MRTDNSIRPFAPTSATSLPAEEPLPQISPKFPTAPMYASVDFPTIGGRWVHQFNAASNSSGLL